MKTLSILGATGSIGTSCLDIVRLHPDRFQVKAMTCATSLEPMARLVAEFHPEMVAVLNEENAVALSRLLTGSHKPEIRFGQEGYKAAAAWPSSDAVLLAMVGAAGLAPALCAIDAQKEVALANKETLVMAGELVMARARQNHVAIRPVDSEHSAIFQCLQGNQSKDLKKIFLTASGGPFRTLPGKEFARIAPEDALNHPTWDMGPKITIDSATLMNKGLEIIEAVHLFDVPAHAIEVLVHPQSIVHSMVGFADGAVIAQMGVPDMKEAISYALSMPDRLNLNTALPDFAGLGSLMFESPDFQKFPSLDFAFEACRQKGTLPCVMNAANEIAVQGFLAHKIKFTDIFDIISTCMGQHTRIDNPSLSGIIEADSWARERALSLI